jgi:hypothetical protein
MNIQSPQKSNQNANTSFDSNKKTTRSPLKLKFEFRTQNSILTETQAHSTEDQESVTSATFAPLFEHSDILFLQKPNPVSSENKKRPLISVDIFKKRFEKANNSKTVEPNKKMFKRRPKKLLKLNIKTIIGSEPEIPTVDRQIKEIYDEAEKCVSFFLLCSFQVILFQLFLISTFLKI